MRRTILMPPVTPSMKDGKVSRWHVAEGQAVAAGDLLVEVATPTATLEIEASSEGHVERILVPAGTEGVKVNTPIAIVLGAAGEGRKSGIAQPMTFAGLDTPPREPMPMTAQSHGQSYREALRDALISEMHADPDVFLIGADVAQNRGAPKVAQGLHDEFGPKRVVSVSTVDEALLGVAVGSAFAGLKPVVELPSWGRSLEVVLPYLTSAAETFYLSGGRLAVPIVFRGPNGFSPGMTGEDARCVAATLAQIPGLKVVQPATASAAKALLQAAIRDPGPVALLEHEQLYPMRELVTESSIPGLGVARIARSGTDVTLAASGHAVLIALDAAFALAGEGIEAEVVDLVSLRPLDCNTVAASVACTGRLVTIEEGRGEGGIGAELIASIVSRSFADLKSPPVRIAGAPVPMPYAAELQALAIPTAEQVVRAVSELIRAR